MQVGGDSKIVWDVFMPNALDLLAYLNILLTYDLYCLMTIFTHSWSV